MSDSSDYAALRKAVPTSSAINSSQVINGAASKAAPPVLMSPDDLWKTLHIQVPSEQPPQKQIQKNSPVQTF
jgi:hypothetical protein